MFVPAKAIEGPLLLMVRSADPVTVVTAVALLLALFVSACVRNAVAGPVFVTARSLVMTVSSVWLLSLSGLGSFVVVFTWATLVKIVPDAVPGGMCPVSVKVAVAPTARLRIEQVTAGPELPQVN